MPTSLLRRSFLLVAVALAACRSTPPDVDRGHVDAPAREAARPAHDVHFVVLHVNDVHGQVLTRKATWIDKQKPPEVGGLPRVAAYVNQARAEARASGEEVLVLDAGDWYQGTPEGLVADGLDFVKALVLVGFDAMCVGNHEFDRGLPNVLRLLREANVPAVCANLRTKDGKERVDWVPPYRVVEKGGVRIALVGLLTTITPEITHPDALSIQFADPDHELALVEKELAGKVDWILPVTHLGVETDKHLARSHPDLALIVGGHSHTLLKEGVREGDTLIVQTGTKASVVGRVEVDVHVPASDDADRRVRVVARSARLVDLLDEPNGTNRSAAVEELCARLEERTKARMQEVVGALGAAATRTKDPLASGSAGNVIADAVRARAKADVGLMNRGGIRTDMEAGPVTRREVFEIMPFDNTLVTMELTGAALEDMLRRAVEGTAHSGLEVSGVVLHVSVDADKKRRLDSVDVGGAPLDPARVYTVAMNSFMADGGDAYLEKSSTAKRVDTGLLIRDVLEDAIAAAKELVPPTENRYAVKTP